jgi:hypothetical protein
MKKIKKLIYTISFQVGVNIIGLPIFETHDFRETIIPKSSKYHS